jgi:hypothetical protein
MPQLRTATFDGSSGADAVMGVEVVGDDDLARSQRRREDVADVALEALSGHGPVEAEGWAEAGAGQRGDDGPVLPLVAGGRRVRPLAARGPRVGRRVAEVAAGLIQPDPGGRIDQRRLLAPGDPGGVVALARPHRLFFRVHSSAVIARLMADGLTSRPE